MASLPSLILSTFMGGAKVQQRTGKVYKIRHSDKVKFQFNNQFSQTTIQRNNPNSQRRYTDYTVKR